MLLIGITGKAGAGKDTVGDVLKDNFGFAALSFAYPIKAAISAMLNVDPEVWNDRRWKETPLKGLNETPRYLAQTLGTEWGRTLVGHNIWVDLAVKRMEFMEWERVVITDVRFENEARMIRNKGILIHVHRDLSEQIDNMSHTSEAGVVPYESDLHIYNNGPLAGVPYEVEAIMNLISGRLERSA